MDDKLKKMSFKDFTVVNPSMTADEYLAYQSQKRRRGHFDTQGESVEHDVEEALSISQRKKAGMRMKRMSKRIQIAKKRAMKRAPTSDVLKKRAQKGARTQLLKKWTRGMDKSELSPARKGELEKKLKKSKGKVDRMAKRLVPQLRKADRERRSASKQTEKK
jgi:hypothetical protein